jgi:hypothetical protein
MNGILRLPLLSQMNFISAFGSQLWLRYRRTLVDPTSPSTTTPLAPADGKKFQKLNVDRKRPEILTNAARTIVDADAEVALPVVFLPVLLRADRALKESIKSVRRVAQTCIQFLLYCYFVPSLS